MKIILLEPGYVRGDAKAGTPFTVDDKVGQELIDAKVAKLDDAEQLQAAEIEGQRAELVALAEQLTGVQGQLQLAVAANAEKDRIIAELTPRVARGEELELYAANLTQQLAERDAEMAGLKEALEVVKAARASTDLPADFPERERLVGAGYATLEAVAVATDAQLDDVPGIGEATIKTIREHLASLKG